MHKKGLQLYGWPFHYFLLLQISGMKIFTLQQQNSSPSTRAVSRTQKNSAELSFLWTISQYWQARWSHRPQLFVTHTSVTYRRIHYDRNVLSLSKKFCKKIAFWFKFHVFDSIFSCLTLMGMRGDNFIAFFVGLLFWIGFCQLMFYQKFPNFSGCKNLHQSG